jgi:hypothetical protein
MNGLPGDGVEGKDRAIMAEPVALAATPFSFRCGVSLTPLTVFAGKRERPFLAAMKNDEAPSQPRTGP